MERFGLALMNLLSYYSMHTMYTVRIQFLSYVCK